MKLSVVARSNGLARGMQVLSLTLLPALLSACKPTPPPVTPAKLPLILGMEYALPGLGPDAAQTRLPGVKFLPEVFGWGKMQPKEGGAINFATLDALVKEYQEAGFAECMVGLRPDNDWASVAPNAPLPNTSFAPKPEHTADFAAWVRAVVERYDGDGVNDMPGLKRPVRWYEIGVEFSSYEPEPAADYLVLLEVGYRAAHDACADAVVMHAAFLVATAFASNPGPEEYDAAFAAVDKRIMYHSIQDIRAVLDRPDLFDAVNFHTYSAELDATAQWLRWEMDQRGYDRPLVISDTLPSSFAGWGPATTCTGAPAGLAIMVAPATEADRCRLADYFTKVVNGDRATLDWVHGYVARDMVQLTVMAADQGIAFVNTSFMQDLTGMNLPIFRAAAGNSAWAGMVDSRVNWFTRKQEVTGCRPLFYALQQLANRLDNCVAVQRVAVEDPAVRLYRVTRAAGAELPDFWVAWYDPGVLLLPGDAVSQTTLTLNTTAVSLTVESVIIQPDQTEPDTFSVPAQAGVASIALTPTPVYILPPS